MSIQFHLDRPTKAGKAKETFEVRVSHDGGERDFAMFSGGEAFRVSFAVRLAMSKLLVRRSGARLETLVIDEGFGTQDPEGRERLVEAINLAREEFGKVLVITHLDDLKDQFGAQIRVEKGIGGSTVALLDS
jgi:exonuclease SbcC